MSQIKYLICKKKSYNIESLPGRILFPSFQNKILIFNGMLHISQIVSFMFEPLFPSSSEINSFVYLFPKTPTRA